MISPRDAAFAVLAPALVSSAIALGTDATRATADRQAAPLNAPLLVDTSLQFAWSANPRYAVARRLWQAHP